MTFLCTVKRIINTSPAFHKLIREEYSIFLDWIYYHEVLGEFTVRHWKVPYEGCGWAPEARSSIALQGRQSKVRLVPFRPQPQFLTSRQATDIIGCPINVLELITQVCRGAIVDQSTNEISEQIASNVKSLEQEIAEELAEYGPVSIHTGNRNLMVSNLHRLACLIYIDRTSHRVSNSYIHHKRLVREGILLLEQMGTCQNAWPLFIIACEATDDDQRLSILSVFERSQGSVRRRSNHIHFIQHLVESVWNQMDLNEADEVDYVTVMNAVIGGVHFIPPFA